MNAIQGRIISLAKQFEILENRYGTYVFTEALDLLSSIKVGKSAEDKP